MTKSKDKKAKANPLWGGHYAQGPSAIMEEINASIDIDKRFYAQDIRASKAHAEMLGKCDIIRKKDVAAIKQGLTKIQKEIEGGSFVFSKTLEDIHMNIESRLFDLIGEPAKRLHTARSRNDQVATDFRLWLRDAIDALDHILWSLQDTLIDKAEEYAALVMPGFTHLQPAQPVTLGHHLLAYVEMISRDRARLSDCRKRVNEMPLGAAALAGTSFPIDRHMVAADLGFAQPMANSMDAVSARDFALEFLSVASILGVHLSRFAEELVLWCSPGFGFITLSEAFTTGSSIMPQKRNPDAAELVRGKTGRLLGNFMTLFTVIKGLSLTYAKDLQEDKEPVFDTVDTLHLMIEAMTGMVKAFKANKPVLDAALQNGFLTATDLADWLVRNLDMPFRQAHHVTGKLVRMAEEKQCQLYELALTEMQKIESKITDDIFSVLSPASAVNSRKSYGGTAPSLVKKAAKTARKKYKHSSAKA